MSPAMGTVAGGLLPALITALIAACSPLPAVPTRVTPSRSGPVTVGDADSPVTVGDADNPVTVGDADSPVTVAPPPAPRPAVDGPCRYLPAAAVQIANGQRVARVQISETGPDQPYPACFFLAGNGTVQLRTWIVVATPEVARATVDAAAPVASSDLAELPGGWSGGSQPTAEGAVFAVSRRGTAVVITTNQHQTISARRTAEQVIAALGL